MCRSWGECGEGKGGYWPGTDIQLGKSLKEGRGSTPLPLSVSHPGVTALSIKIQSGPPFLGQHCKVPPLFLQPGAIPEVSSQPLEAPLCSALPSVCRPCTTPTTPSLGCRMPCIQLWFPGNKTTIKVTGSAGDLHRILSCMDSIFNTQY